VLTPRLCAFHKRLVAQFALRVHILLLLAAPPALFVRWDRKVGTLRDRVSTLLLALIATTVSMLRVKAPLLALLVRLVVMDQTLVSHFVFLKMGLALVAFLRPIHLQVRRRATIASLDGLMILILSPRIV